MLDPHFIRAFYYVYREGGFRRAAVVMHLSQPAVSAQIQALENQLGQPLFGRQPYSKLPLADYLFEQIARPMVERLLEFERRMRDRNGPALRVAASEFIFQHYLVPLLATIEREFPSLRVELKSGPREAVEAAVRDGEARLAIITVEAPPDALAWQPLLSLPVVLLVPADSCITSVDTLLAAGATGERLICPPPGEAVSRRFNAWLAARNVYWPITTQASSTAMVPWLVASGMGVGVCVGASRLLECAGIRALPLAGIEPVTVAAHWRGDITPELREFLELIGQAARKLSAATPIDGHGTMAPPIAVPKTTGHVMVRVQSQPGVTAAKPQHAQVRSAPR